MKYCTECGTQLNDNVRFCPKCGTACYKEENEAADKNKPEETDGTWSNSMNRTEPASNNVEANPGSSSGPSKRNVIIIAIGLAVIIAIIAVFLSRKTAPEPSAPQKVPETSVSMHAPESVPETIYITEAETEAKNEEQTQPASSGAAEIQDKEPESVKDAPAQMTDSELCRLAADYYYAANGVSLSAMVDSSDGDTATIQLFEDHPDHIATIDRYTVSRTSGKGTDFLGNEIDLFVPPSSSNVPASGPVIEGTVSHIFDDAGIFSAADIERINSVLLPTERSMGTDILIVTTNNKGGKTIRNYADDYYDSQMFKGNASPDGVGIIIDMEERTCYITTAGIMIRYLTDYRIERVLDAFFDTYAATGSFSESVVEMINTITGFYNEGIPANQYTVTE